MGINCFHKFVFDVVGDYSQNRSDQVNFSSSFIGGDGYVHPVVTLWRVVKAHVGESSTRTLRFYCCLFRRTTLGLGIGWYPGFAKFFDPVLQLFRQTSAFALFPIFIFVFGIGEFSKVAVISYACVWPILLNTVNGVRNVDPYLIKCARSMAASDWVIFQKVVIPSLIPSLATGVRLAGASAILLLVAAEMIGASAGLGFMIIDSQNTFQPARLYSAIITMAAIGLCTNYFFVYLEKKATVWQEERHIA